MNLLQKFSTLTFYIVFFHTVAFGQEVPVATETQSDELKTILTSPKIKQLGVYVVPEYQFANLAGEFTSMGGGSVMVSLNKKLSIGVSGYSTLGTFSPTQISPDHTLEMSAQFGGAKLEYTLNPNSPIHVSFPLLIGDGRSTIDSIGNHNEGKDYDYSHHDDQHSHHGNEISFLVIQPGINVEANVFRFMKVFGGANYRIVSGGESRTNNTAIESPRLGQMQGLSFNLGIKIGYDFKLGKKKGQE